MNRNHDDNSNASVPKNGNGIGRSDADQEVNATKPIRFRLRTLLAVITVAGTLMAVPLVGRGLFFTAAILAGIMLLQLPIFLIFRHMNGRGEE